MKFSNFQIFEFSTNYINQNKWNKNRKVYFKMSAKIVRNVSIFHISSCQTTCQGINPNKLNNNFLIKLNIFILLRLFGRPNCYWTSDVRKSCSNLLVYDSSVISIYFTPVNSENDRKILKKTKIGETSKTLTRISNFTTPKLWANDVINVGSMVCMNNVQKFFWLWVWHEVWDLAMDSLQRIIIILELLTWTRGRGCFKK